MRISWLSAEEIAAAREALTAGGASWDDHFRRGDGAEFSSPPSPPGDRWLDWAGLTEHVARAERVSAVVREQGLEAARARFGATGVAIEQATLAAAAHEEDVLALDEVIGVLGCPIDDYVFYAPFLELLVSLGRGDLERIVPAYEAFVASYARTLTDRPHGPARVAAVRDGLADFYVSAGRLDEAATLFDRRHDEDRNDVAVALTASRAFLAAGSLARAVQWLGIGATRAAVLGRADLAAKLRQKQDALRKRLS